MRNQSLGTSLVYPNPPDVLLLVLLSDLDVSSSWFQLMGGDFPQDLFVNGEEHLQSTLLDVVIPEELQKCEEL